MQFQSVIRRAALGLVPLALVALLPSAGHAQITSIGIFSGTITENFDSFVTGPIPSPSNIFAGAATISSSTSSLVIYQPGTSEFNLDLNGNAQVQSGAKGLGNAGAGTETITFGTTIGRFGGYLNANAGSPAGATVTLRFFDASNVQIGVDQLVDNNNTNGALVGFGFQSNAGNNIKRVDIIGDRVAMDSLQAANSVIPEPGTIALVASGLVMGGLALRRRRSL